MVMGALERLDPPRVLGDLTLLAALGEGGMATVYLAGVGSGPLARICAVKLLRANLPDHDYRTRFLDEARLVVRLHHNNLVDVRAAGEIDGQLYIAMEAIEGRDLADVWDRCAEVGRAFPVPLAVHVCREVLRGLHYAHTFPGLGLVHRDVSPSNVLIDWAGAVRLADFGLATSSLKASLTLPGIVFGKVGYMSPEQARHEPLDGRADVYAVAVVLWELLTGRALRNPDGISTDAVSRFEAPPPSARSRRVDARLDEIVARGLARDRNQRWESAHAMMVALGQWLAEHAPEMGQESVAEFMRQLFGDARERESAARADLLRELTGAHRSASGAGSATQILERSSGEHAGGEALGRDSRGAHRPGSPSSSGDNGGLELAELLEPGVVIADRYRVLSRLGRGGMGYVYLGEHVTVGRSVAIKVLTFDWSRTPAVAQRFRAEARAASAAGHPNIIEVFDAGELPDGRLYLVMEFLTGRNLFEEVQTVGPLAVPRACHIMRDTARAIRAAHEVGIIHRDLKPDNVMLVDRGRDEGELVKVLDFGISSSAERPQATERLTTVGQALGTPEYMAPEQAKGHEPDARFDIYALGAMFFELLTGDPPFCGPNVYEIVTRKTSEAAPSVGSRRDDLPAELITLVDDCLALDPRKRPQTAQIFLARLEDVLRRLPRVGAELAGSTPPPVPTDPGPRRARDEPVAAGKLAATAVAAAASATATEPSDAPTSAPVQAQPRGRSPGLLALAAGLIAVVALGITWAQLRGRDDGREPVADTPREPTPAADPAPGPAPSPDRATATGGSRLASAGTDTGTNTGTNTEAGEHGEHGLVEPREDTSSPPEPGETDATPDPGPTIAKHETAACKQVRADAEQAANEWKWDQVLALTKDRKCWSSRSDRARLEVQAYMEKGRWDDCVRAGKGATGQVKGWVNICASKQ